MKRTGPPELLACTEQPKPGHYYWLDGDGPYIHDAEAGGRLFFESPSGATFECSVDEWNEWAGLGLIGSQNANTSKSKN